MDKEFPAKFTSNLGKVRDVRKIHSNDDIHKRYYNSWIMLNDVPHLLSHPSILKAADKLSEIHLPAGFYNIDKGAVRLDKYGHRRYKRSFTTNGEGQYTIKALYSPLLGTRVHIEEELLDKVGEYYSIPESLSRIKEAGGSIQECAISRNLLIAITNLYKNFVIYNFQLTPVAEVDIDGNILQCSKEYKKQVEEQLL